MLRALRNQLSYRTYAARVKPISDADVLSVVDQEIEILEKEKRICVFYAVETGAAAHGIQARDSPRNVRFLYTHAPEWYFSLARNPETIELPPIKLRDVAIDMNGLEFRHAVKLLRDSKAPMVDWLRTPGVYRKVGNWVQEFNDSSLSAVSRRLLSQQYRHQALFTLEKLTKERESMSVRRFLLALRPTLALLWLQQNPEGLPPMDTSLLLQNTKLSAPGVLKDRFMAVIRKRHGDAETEVMDQEPEMFAWIANTLDSVKQYTQTAPHVKMDLQEADKWVAKAIHLNAPYIAALAAQPPVVIGETPAKTPLQISAANSDLARAEMRNATAGSTPRPTEERKEKSRKTKKTESEAVSG